MKKQTALILAAALMATATATAATHPNRIDPELRTAALAIRMSIASDADVAANAITPQPVPDDINRQAITLPERPGAPALELSAYRPRSAGEGEALPAIVLLHGGAMLLRNAYYAYGQIQDLSDLTGCEVLVPRYRLSTEAPYPAPLEDAAYALTTIYHQAQSLGLAIDRERLMLMGMGGGGLLAAGLALHNRDNDRIPVRAQILAYPMLDCRTGTYATPHPGLDGETVVWNAASNAYAWKRYLGGKRLSHRALREYSPALARTSDLEELPPAFIYTGGIDLLAPEAMDYAARLTEAGVQVELHIPQGVCHSFDTVSPDAAATREYQGLLSRFVSRTVYPAAQ
ncbi:MAG: alpha/beta hydrolase [Succinivibrionaceae bacterium]|nr:alpha/beta hydrolase [Succinivibrionaceae bacterium]